MRVQVDAPWWFRFRLLAWLARITGVSRRWEASGCSDAELMVDLRRLGAEVGFRAYFDHHGGLCLSFDDQRVCIVTTEGTQ